MPALYGPTGQIIKKFFYDATHKRSIIKFTQDIEPIVERNKARQKNPVSYTKKGQTFHHVAEVPFTMIYKWLAEDGLEPRRLFRMGKEDKNRWLAKHLNDNDNKYLRSVTGRI